MAIADGITTNPDGTAVVHACGQRVKLRLPTVGELRKLTEILNETQDEERVARAVALEEDAADGEPEPDESLPLEEMLRAQNAERRERSNAVIAKIEEGRLQAYDQLLGMLGDKPLEAPHEQWPGFFTTLQPLADLIVHWRTSPLAPGQ